jgi:hypothetical protein
MSSGRRILRRILPVAAVASILPLLVLSGFLLLQGEVRSRLGRLDPDGSFGAAFPGPGIIELDGAALPGYGFSSEEVFVYWNGNPFSPELDSVLVGASVLDADVCMEGREGAGGGPSRTLPPVRIGGLVMRSRGEQVGTLTGRLSGWGDGERFDGTVSGEWGTAVLAIGFRAGPDSLRMTFSDLMCPPPGTIDLPSRLRGYRVGGELAGEVSPGFLRVDGLLSSVDGSAVEIPFTLASDGGDVSADLHLDISRAGGLIEARFDSLFPGAWLETSPSGDFRVTVSGSDSIFMGLCAFLDSTRLYSPIVARDTLDMTLFVQCTGVYIPEDSILQIDSGTVRLGGAEASFSARFIWGECRRARVRVWNDSLPGSAISSSVPAPLLGRLRGLRLGGSAGFDVGLTLDWDDPDSSDVWIDVDVSRLYVESSPIGIGQLCGTGATCTMRDSWGNSRVIGLDTLSNPDFVVFDSLPASFEPLVCCAEDASFRSHSGFSIYHIRDSVRADVSQGRLARGGSTITMQLAKNLFLGREKTFARKLQEVFLTWRLEVYLTKDRILELYANIVEMGPNVFGLGEAARYYFGVDARDLSVRQTAFLVSILPGPRLYHRFALSGVPAYWDSYLDRLIGISMDRGWLSREAGTRGLNETLVFHTGADR